MLATPTKDSGIRFDDNAVGKCICVSIPYHQLNILDELDKNARQHFRNRSEYIRMLVIEDVRRKRSENI
jgi:metal-responsive CopG/Arc/MetJ family transcriptional regulator